MLAAGVGYRFGVGEDAPPKALLRFNEQTLLRSSATTATIFVLRPELERRAGSGAVRQPSLSGLELEGLMYLLGPITWFGLLQPFLLLAGIGAPLFALLVLWECRRLFAGRPVG